MLLWIWQTTKKTKLDEGKLLPKNFLQKTMVLTKHWDGPNNFFFFFALQNGEDFDEILFKKK